MHSEAADFIGAVRPTRRVHSSSAVRNLPAEHASTVSVSLANSDNRCEYSPAETVQAGDAGESVGLFEWQNGPLLDALLQPDGAVFLIDEISLAEDSVLERLNSLLEPQNRSLVINEQSLPTRSLQPSLSSLGDNSSATTQQSGPAAQKAPCRQTSVASAAAHVIHATDSFRLCASMNPGGDFGKKELSPSLRNRFTEVWCLSPLDSVHGIPAQSLSGESLPQMGQSKVECLSDLQLIVSHNLFPSRYSFPSEFAF